MPIIIFISIIHMSALFMLTPVLPLVREFYEISEHHISYIMQSFAISSIIGAIVLGTLSDKFGRKPMLLLGVIGSALSYIITIYADTYSLFLLSRVASGFFNGSFCVAFAASSDISTPETRLKNMATLGAAFAISMIIGPTLGGFSTSFSTDLRSMMMAPFMVSIVLYTIATLLILFLFKETLTKKTTKIDGSNVVKDLYKLFSNKSFLFTTCLNIAYTMVMTVPQIFIGLYLTEFFNFDPIHIGYFWSTMAVFMVVSQGIIRKYLYNKSSKIMIVSAFATMAIGFLGLNLANNLIAVYFFMIIICMASAFLSANIMTKISLSGEGNLGMTMGIGQSLSAIGRSLGPILGSYLIVTGSYTTAWLVLAIICCGLSVASFLGLKSAPKKSPTPTPSSSLE